MPDDAGHSAPPVGAEGVSEAEKSLASDSHDFPLTEGMCLSGWLEGVRHNPLLDHRTTDALPSTADYVIIGAGITGSLCALELLKTNPGKSVVLLEARELCSGATGRNAGHCKPDQWRGFTKYAEEHGMDQSLKILANEQETWEKLVAYVREHKVDCELWVGKTLDVMMTEDCAADAAKTMAAFKAAGGDASKIEVVTEAFEAERLSRLKGAKAVYAWDASTLYPWKLVAHIVEAALDLGLNVQTWTLAREIQPSESDRKSWRVYTDRGAITAPVIIHATNAYAGALLPETKHVIRPTPHMCNRVIPPSSFSGSRALQNSYAVIMPNGLYSINPRLEGDGVILFGGSAPNQQKLMDYVAEDPVNRRADDSLMDFEPVTDAVKTLTRDNFGWVDRGQGSRARYDYAWSGIIGRSADNLPFIGALPGKPGQWICAGHNGHGMARIFTCAPGLVKLVNGATWEETRLPESFEITTERLDRLREVHGQRN
ncbi:putative FAD dependent oxidoreductase [Kockovaella imperatae]|uniref:Putative FAD dependent oxidoreductase n=1 Tax=Kockovaella imperatae TaxID=4999 RepID=A0A1Y1UBX1_9TREE|nr:putative FAD dependent oxidoreductase [Kockovaella imperatae]ORX34976.1 putative FAD dependent oxidoreductase [Kockovaella imperatae]